MDRIKVISDYVDYLPTLGHEPDYDEVINAAKDAMKYSFSSEEAGKNQKTDRP